jgi:aryl-alcohol dehydrogenase-like predicted oxidoreductase
VSKVKYGTWIRELGGWDVLQDMLATLHKVGRRYGVPPSVVAVRWVLQQDGVAAAVVGARNALHLADARRAFSFSLTEDDALDIDAAWESARQPTGDVYAWERGGPFN